MASDDPEFEEKAADILAYTSSRRGMPRSSASMRRALSRPLIGWTQSCRFRPGRAERHGFEYYRHGTLSLYAALNIQTGEVLGKTTARHTSTPFVDFLGQVVASQPSGREIHVIADNLSAHKTKQL